MLCLVSECSNCKIEWRNTLHDLGRVLPNVLFPEFIYDFLRSQLRGCWCYRHLGVVKVNNGTGIVTEMSISKHLLALKKSKRQRIVRGHWN